MSCSASIPQTSVSYVTYSAPTQVIVNYNFNEVLTAIENEKVISSPPSPALPSNSPNSSIIKDRGFSVEDGLKGRNKVIVGLVVLLLMSIGFLVGFAVAGHIFKAETILSSSFLCVVKAAMVIYLYFFGKDKKDHKK